MSTQQSCWISLFHAMVVSNKLIRSVIKLANGMKVWWVTPTPRAYKRPSAGRTLHTQVTLLLSFSTREQPQQPTPCVATTETTMAAWAVAATATAAWAVAAMATAAWAVAATAMAAWAMAMAPAMALASAGWALAMAVATALAPALSVEVATAMAPALSVEVAVATDVALALATTIEDAVEDSHPLHLDTRIHQLWSPHVLCLCPGW